MKIAHVITRMILGGAQENTLLNCIDLAEMFGDEVLLVTGPAIGPEGTLLEAAQAAPIQVALIDSLRREVRPWRDFQAYRSIQAVLHKFKPEVVHTHSAKGGILGRFAASSLQVPAIVHTVHGAPFGAFHSASSATEAPLESSAQAQSLSEQKPKDMPAAEEENKSKTLPFQNPLIARMGALCEWGAAARCHAMISVADAMTAMMVDHGIAPREKFTTIYSGMEVAPFLQAESLRESTRQSLGFSPDEIVVGKIARLSPLKGHDDLLAAAHALLKEDDQGGLSDIAHRLRFLFVGDGIFRERLQSKINQLGIAKHFVFTGLRPSQEMPELLAAMDLLVHTSLREGLARVLPQALLASRPVISYDVDGAGEVVLPGETGILVRPRDLHGLQRGILTLAQQPALRAQYGRQGRERFKEVFDHRYMTRRIRELYVKILNRSPGPGQGRGKEKSDR